MVQGKKEGEAAQGRRSKGRHLTTEKGRKRTTGQANKLKQREKEMMKKTEGVQGNVQRETLLGTSIRMKGTELTQNKCKGNKEGGPEKERDDGFLGLEDRGTIGKKVKTQAELKTKRPGELERKKEETASKTQVGKRKRRKYSEANHNH